jgi:phage terminase large subunit
MSEILIPEVAIPPKLIPVFSGPAEVRGAWGGRGSGKTMTFAKMTAIRAFMWDQAGREGVIVCGREKLNSLDDSSMAEVKAAIASEPWLREHFSIGEKYIRTKSKRISYKFSGLDKKTVMSLKSKAKILLLWADEAEPITDAAWDIVLPTLRQEDSELWVTWNPARKNSATDRRFRQTKDPLYKVVEMNYRDNPRFPAILERQRQRWMKNDPDSYDHVWEGAYATAVKGAYFTRQLSALRAEGRLCRVAADPNMKRLLFADIGGTGVNADAFTMWGGQFIGREVRVLNYYEQVGQEIGHHLTWMRKRNYLPENTEIFLPHDGATHDKVFSVSYQSAFERAGYSVTVVPNQGKGAAISRINAARRVFPSVWMNLEEKATQVDEGAGFEPTTADGLEALGWYHEKWDEERDIGLGPEHDWASHGSDAWGLMAIVAEDRMRAGAGIVRTAKPFRRRGSPMAV